VRDAFMQKVKEYWLLVSILTVFSIIILAISIIGDSSDSKRERMSKLKIDSNFEMIKDNGWRLKIIESKIDSLLIELKSE
jgi:hypothetical protein